MFIVTLLVLSVFIGYKLLSAMPQLRARRRDDDGSPPGMW